MATQTVEAPHDAVDTAEAVVVRFAGDSGDGMQLTGGQFTLSTALAGNDLATFPDFPAEIRAPQGTLFGVSAFQINFGSRPIDTAGDAPDVLVAMNPAALKTNLEALKPGGLVIADTGEFTKRNLDKAKYDANPIEDGSLAKWDVLAFDISAQTVAAVKPFGLGNKDALRCKNMWTLGLALWMFDRPREPIHQWLHAKFKSKPELADANIAALDAGHAYGETAELSGPLKQLHVAPVASEAGLYRTITGAEAVSLGLVAGAQLAHLPLFFGGYPITPASAILHHLARLKEFGVTTFQAEDEIAAICAAIGASYAGSLGITSSSGPGIALKGEAMGLAIMTELPLVIVNSQRGGPSTGLPTKTEQSDLYQAVYGRNGDAPMPVIAARSPSDAFEVAIEACRIAVEYMTPVMLLTDGYIANAAEPWKVPDPASFAEFPATFLDAKNDGENLLPYKRNATGARPWIKPGTPELMHRIGGIEKHRADRQHRLFALQPPGDDRRAPRQGAGRQGTRPAGRGRREQRQAGGGGLGQYLWSDPPGGAARPAQGVRGQPHPRPPHLAAPRQSGRSAARLRQGAGARDEQRPVQDRAARPIPRRRPAAHQGQRPTFPDRGTGSGNRDLFRWGTRQCRRERTRHKRRANAQSRSWSRRWDHAARPAPHA